MLEDAIFELCGGAQVEIPAIGQGVRPCTDTQPHVTKFQVRYLSGFLGKDDDSRFSPCFDVVKADPADGPGGDTRRAGDGRHVDRLTVTPPVTGVQAGVHDHVGEDHVLDRTSVTAEDAEAAIRFFNDQMTEDQPPDGLGAVADANAARPGLEHTVGHYDVLGVARAVTHRLLGIRGEIPHLSVDFGVELKSGDNDRVVTGLHVAVGDPHPA